MTIWFLFYSDFIIWDEVFIPPSPLDNWPSPPTHQSEATKEIPQFSQTPTFSATTTREGGDVEIVVIVYCSIGIGKLSITIIVYKCVISTTINSLLMVLI